MIVENTITFWSVTFFCVGVKFPHIFKQQSIRRTTTHNQFLRQYRDKVTLSSKASLSVTFCFL